MAAGAHHGEIFLSALGAYTLVRQRLLRLRQERRTSTLVGPLTVVTAAGALVAGTVGVVTS